MHDLLTNPVDILHFSFPSFSFIRRNRILKLPPVDTKTILVSFSPAERQFYDALHRKSLDLFEGFIRAGTASKSWLTIFSLLHRLRQTCDHVALTIKAHQDQGEWDSKIAAAKQQGEQQPDDDDDDAIAEPPSEAIDQRVSYYFGAMKTQATFLVLVGSCC
jgi:SNF2 family DNA or RNA helicase